jgi:hypothetical protein
MEPLTFAHSDVILRHHGHDSNRYDRGVPLDDAAFRTQLRAVVNRSGLSLRQLSRAMDRDPGYVAALLDPSRPSRARPTPEDLLRLSDATGIAFVELIELLWGIDRARLSNELEILGSAPGARHRRDARRG